MRAHYEARHAAAMHVRLTHLRSERHIHDFLAIYRDIGTA